MIERLLDLSGLLLSELKSSWVNAVDFLVADVLGQVLLHFHKFQSSLVFLGSNRLTACCCASVKNERPWLFMARPCATLILSFNFSKVRAMLSSAISNALFSVYPLLMRSLCFEMKRTTGLR